jgi:hypothetical protein
VYLELGYVIKDGMNFSSFVEKLCWNVSIKCLMKCLSKREWGLIKGTFLAYENILIRD